MNIQLISISLYLRRLTPNKGTPQSSAVTDRRSLFAGTMRPLSGAAGESLGDQERAPRVLKQQQQRRRRMGTTSRQRRSCCYTTHFFFEPRPAAPVHSALRRTGSQPTCRQFVPRHFDLKQARRVPQPLGNGLTRLRAPSVPRLFEAPLAGMRYRADVAP